MVGAVRGVRVGDGGRTGGTLRRCQGGTRQLLLVVLLAGELLCLDELVLRVHFLLYLLLAVPALWAVPLYLQVRQRKILLRFLNKVILSDPL